LFWIATCPRDIILNEYEGIEDIDDIDDDDLLEILKKEQS